MTASRIAFAVSNEFPNLTDDDKLAAEALRRRGLAVDAALWDQPRAWNDYDAVVVRSCWDYHHRLDEFKTWLSALDVQGVTVWNQAEVMRWNMDKNYLSELQDQGAAVLPSVWLPQGARADLAHILAEKGWQQAVMKPTVSAAADNTHSIAANDAAQTQPAFEQLLRQGGVIVQEFAPEIQTQGEWSFLFFGGQFSHAVLKQPKSGDFRVQRNYGGTVGSAQPSAKLVEQAGRILDYVESDLLYARVDVIEREGQLLLMELELVEPHLFFEQDSESPERFAAALQERLAVRSQ